MRRAALGVIFLANVAIAAVYAGALITGGAPSWSGVVLAVGTALTLVGLMALGALRGRAGLGPLWLAFGFVFVVLAGGFLLALTLPPETLDSPLYLGLPRRAAIIMYGIGLLPAFIVPAAYALTFDRMTLSESDLERVRAARLPEHRV